ncbi:MAG: hypothetical protein GY953_35590, partial [bacterium]|nr:hypothetical protein [bacterium]
MQPNLNVLLFTAAVALLTGVLFGLVPALRAMATAPASSLRVAGRIGETRFSRRFGKSLVVVQVALSVVLVSAAGLFVHHLSNLRNNLGFDRDRLLLVTLDPKSSGYSGERLSSAYRELLTRVKAIPGVRSATLSGVTPIHGAAASRRITVEGFQEIPAERRFTMMNWIAPGYFETLGTPLLLGRNFTFHDRGSSRLAIVNQAMAKYYFGDHNPIGGRFWLEGDERPHEIIGVVGDAKYVDPRETTLRTLYFTAFQEGRMFSNQLVLRTTMEPAAVVPLVRRAVNEVADGVAVKRITTMAAQVDAAMVPERLIATLSSTFGSLGLLLAAIGLYGLLAYTVARRTAEIGVRMALGATGSDVGRMVLRDALGMVCAGLAVGATIALWGKRFAAGVMENLPLDSLLPVAFGGAAMIAVALLAVSVPARRAARVDPMEALRHESRSFTGLHPAKSSSTIVANTPSKRA